MQNKLNGGGGEENQNIISQGESRLQQNSPHDDNACSTQSSTQVSGAKNEKKCG